HRANAADRKQNREAFPGRLRSLLFLGGTFIRFAVVVDRSGFHFQLRRGLNRLLVGTLVLRRGNADRFVALSAADLAAPLVVVDGVDRFASRTADANRHGEISSAWNETGKNGEMLNAQ